MPALLSAFVSAALTIFTALALSWFSVDQLSSYGLGIFLFTPIVCGAIAAFVYNFRKPRDFGGTILVSLLTGVLTLGSFLATGFEGLICLAMAVPIVLPLYTLGGILGYFLAAALNRRFFPNSLMLCCVLLVPLFMGFEASHDAQPQLRSTRTSVIIHAPAHLVWEEIIAFSPIPEPEEWIFKTGIAYPIDARIEGQGVGAIRFCNFSTGTFVEPITHWEENVRLAFDVVEQPIPMMEISPFDHIHPPHLDWAVQSVRGEFRLLPYEDGTLELVGTTYYTTVMRPAPYWSWIIDHIIHRIHLRVLNHIKVQVEGRT